LNAPLRNDEQLVRTSHRVVKSPSAAEVKKTEGEYFFFFETNKHNINKQTQRQT